MAKQNFSEESGYYYSKVHPQKFMLWCAMASISMMFIAFTSALIVKKGDVQYWQDYKLPSVFAVSTLVILLSSWTIHQTVKAYSNGDFKKFRNLLSITFVLSLVFLGMQFAGWIVMQSQGMTWAVNSSGDFIYLISGAHALHLIGGIVVLMIIWIKAMRSRRDPLFEVQAIINPRKKLNLELLAGYWHFVDLLWVYLFLFFTFTY